MALLLLAVAFLGLGVVIVTLLALTSWLSRPVGDAQSMTGRRLVDGAVFGACVLLAASVGAGLGVVLTFLGMLCVEGTFGVDLHMTQLTALLAAGAGAAGGAAWLGAFRTPPVAGAARGVGVLAFALVAGAGTALSPVNDAGAWHEVAVAASAALGAALAAAGSFAPAREP